MILTDIYYLYKLKKLIKKERKVLDAISDNYYDISDAKNKLLQKYKKMNIIPKIDEIIIDDAPEIVKEKESLMYFLHTQNLLLKEKTFIRNEILTIQFEIGLGEL